ncbi:MAG: ubiquitin [Eubacteriales bacterium]
MATLEQVEKLREKANVSYDEAKAALDAAGGDILEALIALERAGKTNTPPGGGFYSSSSDKTTEEPQTARKTNYKYNGESFMGVLKKIGRFLLSLLQTGNANSFEIYKHGELKSTFPITVLVILLVVAFWITLPLLVIGLFFGFRYRFSGPDLGKESVNNVMDDAANAADNIKKTISEEHHKDS